MKIKAKDYYNNIENCKEICSKCRNRNELQIKYSNIYNIMKKNGLLEIFYPKNIIDYNNLEQCKEICKLYKSRGELSKKNYTAYNKMLKNGMLNIIYPKRKVK
jgi:hypothetical protein